MQQKKKKKKMENLKSNPKKSLCGGNIDTKEIYALMGFKRKKVNLFFSRCTIHKIVTKHKLNMKRFGIHITAKSKGYLFTLYTFVIKECI